MNRAALIKKLEAMIEEAERSRMFGAIEISIRDGVATAIHTHKTDRLVAGENPRHANKSY